MSMAILDTETGLPDGLRKLLETSNLSLTVADCKRSDYPLVGANRKFLEICGYEEAEIIGRNCRFLQPQGGAGPVTVRIRRFLTDPSCKMAKFLVPNETRDGEPFLNLVYLSKLLRGGETQFVLGTQFRVGGGQEELAYLYDRARREDLRKHNLLTSESNSIVLGSFDALASSHSIIAQARIE